MFRRVAMLAAAGVLLLPSVALAATSPVTVVDFAFQPGSRRIALGDRVRWTNTGSFTHTTTGDLPLALWDETLSPDEAWPRPFRQAGSFGYFCDIHGSMRGSVKVPVRVTPSSGGLNTLFTVRVATVDAPAGFEFVIQRRRNNGAWSTWRTTTEPTQTFDPASSGTWRFRSQLRRISNGATSGFSPADRIEVS
jgi:plastocyanin